MQSVIATKSLETEPSQERDSRLLALLFPDAFRPVSIVNNAGQEQDTCHQSQNTRYAIASAEASLKKTEKIARGILPIPDVMLHISLRQTAGVTDR